MKNKQIIKKAFKMTLPVLTGYAVLGMGFGILARSMGISGWIAICMSIFIYAGSMQYAAMGLFTGGASFLSCAITTFMVNSRHIFYGISMIHKFKKTGKYKPYLIFSLTDETYSLLVSGNEETPEEKRNFFYFAVSLMDQLYWVLGTAAGVLLGSFLSFNTEGIDFSLTALFVTIFLGKMGDEKNRLSGIIGVAVTLLCLIIFGKENFLLPAMMVICLVLCFYKEAGNESK